MNVRIRKASKKDGREVLNLLNSDVNLVGDETFKYRESHFKEYLKNPVNKLFVAEINHKIVGLILVEFWKIAKYVYLNDLVIDRDHRRRGIATKLMKHVESIAKKQKMKFLFGFSEINNKKTHQLLGKLNYRLGKKFYFFSKTLR